MSTALVLARTERRRFLRELLSIPEMTVAQRARYAELIADEFRDTMGSDDGLLAAMQERGFRTRVESGVGIGEALEQSQRLTLKDFGLEQTEGQKERERRRRLREAVTAFDARAVVTLRGGWAKECLVCGKPLLGWRREDRVYCPGGACKQKAARIRKSRGLSGAA